MIQILGGFALILCGLTTAAAGFFFYFVGGICGEVKEGLTWGIGGLFAAIVGTVLICFAALNDEKDETNEAKSKG